ncbi:conserved hypothetical protein [Trichinella spiralis]|uniref:hypothetical protein n=1 Tax=Trichinella spiralis TaxID=6334 RepID=UPI0001EFBA25|nr:conserved hypothetical protein [Trichinella spiralis]
MAGQQRKKVGRRSCRMEDVKVAINKVNRFPLLNLNVPMIRRCRPSINTTNISGDGVIFSMRGKNKCKNGVIFKDEGNVGSTIGDINNNNFSKLIV